MFHFSANLKPYNVFRGRGNHRFDSYLLSVDFSDEHKELAALIVDEGRVLCADNGNVDLIGEFIERHRLEVQPLQERRKAEEEILDHKARPGQLSSSLTSSFRKLAEGILSNAKNAISQDHVTSTLLGQESLNPRYIVGMEDFTIVTLTALNVEPEYSNLPAEWYLTASQRAIEFAVETKSGDFGPNKSSVFGGLHAIDFDSAKQAGELAGKAKLDGIASGMVGVLKDKTFIDFRMEDGEVIELPRNIPRPYMRTLQIIAGFHIGFASVTDRRPAFHGLGVGSPILLPLISLLGDIDTYLAVDSTAPIKDAFANVISLYVDTPAPRKLKAYRIAEFWLAENDGWRCECPYCRNFRKRHPPNLPAALDWWQGEEKRRLRAEDMHAPSPLAELLPLLSTPEDVETRSLARTTRILHNHWVLKRIETNIRKHSINSTSLRIYIEKIMETYLSLTGSNRSWQEAARVAWKIAENASETLPKPTR